MAEHLADLRQRSAVPQHPRRQGVSEHMSAAVMRTNLSAIQSTQNNTAHSGRAEKTNMGRTGTDEHMPGRTMQSDVLQIVRQCLANILA